MTFTTGKRAQHLAKIRADITQFVIDRDGVSTADIAAKFHMTDGSIRRHAVVLADAGQIMRLERPNIGFGVVSTLWFAPGTQLPVFVRPIKSRKQRNDFAMVIKGDAVQTGMVRSDPLMVCLFGPAKS